MSSSDRSSSSPIGSSRGGRGLRGWIVFTGAVVAGLALFVIIRTQGHVTGEEFSPSHFQQRQFEFYEIPLLHLQITPIRRTASTSETARYVRQRSLIAVAKGPPESWHLVWIARGVTGSSPGDAALLTSQLELDDQGSAYWQSWSEQHPRRAAVLWPLVQRLAMRELYVLIPALMEIAQREPSVAALQAGLDRYLPQEYGQLIREMRAAGRHELATQLLHEAREDYPEDPELAALSAPLSS